MAPALCRDCVTLTSTGFDLRERTQRCSHCKSPRLVSHSELTTLSIAHIDCDAFFAAIEKRDRPELQGKPVIIGGGRRGVVSTACYVARLSGVHSAMPMFKALKACPDAVVLRPDLKRYSLVAQEIRQIMRDVTPAIEPVSIDEAYLDLTGTERLHGSSAAESLCRLAKRVESELRLTVSMGLSFNKFLAKLASDMEKPRGFTVIGRSDAKTVLASLPVSKIPGVGRVMARKLAQIGLATIGDIQATSPDRLVGMLGNAGLWLLNRANGMDQRKVQARTGSKTISCEATFDRDISYSQELRARLHSLASRLSKRALAQNLAGSTVTLKLKTPDFRVRSRTTTVAKPISNHHEIREVACRLFDQQRAGQAYRLMGIGLGRLTATNQGESGDLFNAPNSRHAELELAVSKVAKKFGDEAISTARTLTRRPKS